MKKIIVALVILLLALLTVFFGQLRDRLALNLVALDTTHILQFGLPFFYDPPSWLSESQSCSANWMKALQAGAQGDIEERNEAYKKAIICDKSFVTYIEQMHRYDIPLSQMALDFQPECAESWFWSGDLHPEKKIEYYRQGLKINPKDGRRWSVLGHLLKHTDPQAAMNAFIQACFNGDPGYHGCGNAGLVAESLGLYEDAILYYRSSGYDPIREKSDILERKLTPTP